MRFKTKKLFPTHSFIRTVQAKLVRDIGFKYNNTAKLVFEVLKILCHSTVAADFTWKGKNVTLVGEYSYSLKKSRFYKYLSGGSRISLVSVFKKTYFNKFICISEVVTTEIPNATKLDIKKGTKQWLRFTSFDLKKMNVENSL